MGDMSAHFDRREFMCKCGCGRNNISADLVNKLESVFDYLARTPTGCKSCVITSGIRCPSYSESVGGFRNDAHTLSIAADCIYYQSDGKPYAPETVAAVAEKLGFSGIGLMKGAIHLDIRNEKNYTNSHWFGDERTGENYIKTFSQYLPKITETPKTTETVKHKIKLMLDDKIIFENEI